MDPRTSKTLTLLGGVATLALGSSFLLRLSTPRDRTPQVRCAPRLLELEQAVCEPLSVLAPATRLADLSPSPR